MIFFYDFTRLWRIAEQIEKIDITPQQFWLGHISDRKLCPNFLCKPFCGGPSRFSRILIGKSSCFEKTIIDLEKIRTVNVSGWPGHFLNEKRISRVLAQTASIHLLLSPRKLTSCAHNNKYDRRFPPGPHTDRPDKKTSKTPVYWLLCPSKTSTQHAWRWNDQSAS